MTTTENTRKVDIDEESPKRFSFLVLMASIREKLQFANVASIAKGTAVTLIIAASLSLAFMGFAGLGSGG